MADFDSGYTADSAPSVLSRGMLVRLPLLRREDGRPITCCVLGGPQATPQGDGFVPVAVVANATVRDPPLRQLYVRPEECRVYRTAPSFTASKWNRLALVYEGSTIENKYAEAADHVSHLLEAMHPPHGLWPVYIDRSSGQFTGERLVTFGGMGDSMYEYLLKGWLQTGKKEEWLWEMYRKSMDGARERAGPVLSVRMS